MNPEATGSPLVTAVTVADSWASVSAKAKVPDSTEVPSPMSTTCQRTSRSEPVDASRSARSTVVEVKCPRSVKSSELALPAVDQLIRGKVCARVTADIVASAVVPVTANDPA